MSLMVYIPGGVHKTRTIALLREVGLEALHDEGLSLEFADVLDNGPDGADGLLCGWGGAEPLHLNLAAQEWHPLKPHGELPAGRAWIGWNRSQRPGPDQLARGKQLTGQTLTLADGNDWLLPVARQLPKLIGLDDCGRVSAVIAPQYQQFFRRSRDLLLQFAQRDGSIVIGWDDGFDFAVQAVQMNYRITRDVAAALGLFTDQLFWEIPKLVTEANYLAAMAQKKSEEAASDTKTTSDGESG